MAGRRVSCLLATLTREDARTLTLTLTAALQLGTAVERRHRGFMKMSAWKERGSKLTLTCPHLNRHVRVAVLLLSGGLQPAS